MKTKSYERRAVLGNIVLGSIAVAAIFAGYVLYTANPGEVVREKREQKEAVMWNAEVASLIESGDFEGALEQVAGSVYELSKENADAIQKWQELVATEKQYIADTLGEIRATYISGDKETAETNLRALGATYPDSAYVKAYLELFGSVEKTMKEEDMYDWKSGGAPSYGTYKDYRGNSITGFCIRSNYLSNGEYGYFDTKSYMKVTIKATCIAIGSETLPITIMDMNTQEEYTIYCPKGSVCEAIEISGGDIRISTPDESAHAYGSVVLEITVTKELTDADFEAVDVRY